MPLVTTGPSRSRAAATAHPVATEAALEVLDAGGSAVDGAIAAQAVICVLMPHAAGLGGDVLALSRTPDGSILGLNGTGRSPRALDPGRVRAGAPPGASVTVPGLVQGWLDLHDHQGRLPLDALLAPAVRVARSGFVVEGSLAASLDAQRDRLAEVSPDSRLVSLRDGGWWVQPELADTLELVAERGAEAIHAGPLATAVAGAVRRAGGWLDVDDLAEHTSELAAPLRVGWDGGELAVQPPHSQGILLAMALAWLEEDAGRWGSSRLSHLLVELTEAVFEHRDDCAKGTELLGRQLVVDPDHAARRGGPRPYLHTAGVAVATGDGDVVSSLVSVFDDFGSGVWVPEGGFVLNNRADGFTVGSNAPAPGARPVHTLAPVLLTDRDGQVTGLATPGADGQVQTLLQVLAACRRDGIRLEDAIAAPRWRSHDTSVVAEPDHPDLEALRRAGHQVVLAPRGDDLFGSVVAAGVDAGGARATADWRRGSVATTHPVRSQP